MLVNPAKRQMTYFPNILSESYVCLISVHSGLNSSTTWWANDQKLMYVGAWKLSSLNPYSMLQGCKNALLFETPKTVISNLPSAFFCINIK